MMNILDLDILLIGLRGKIGKEYVFKQYKGRTLITKYPDMSKVVLTEKQLKHRARFRAATLWAKRHLEEFREEAAKKNITPYCYGTREFFRRGLQIEDLERELAAERHQKNEKKEEKRGIVNWIMLGMLQWLMLGNEKENPKRISNKNYFEGERFWENCTPLKWGLDERVGGYG